MQLTQKQESLITRYLNEVLDQIDTTVPESVRERGLTRLRNRIYRELGAVSKNSPDEADVRAVLERFGEPAYQASALFASRATSEEFRLSRDNRVWLGVCSGVADQIDVPPWVVRLLAVALGCATGPLALFAYLAVYLWFYLRSDPEEEPRIRKAIVLWRSISAFVIVLILHIASTYAVRLIYFVHEKYLQRPMPELSDWGWLEMRAGELFFYALAICVPMALMSAMPLSNAWEYTLKRLSQAFLALYAIILSFGLASIIVGLIMNFIHEYT
ncbi:MAG TPA: PspC domain-containing protein [Candidatus Hydrogenedentes bacterium]|nr:PspC domain-containing protein [Candidatus Hydrogenedentota bacterium]